MPNREKVINALGCIAQPSQNGACGGCTYFRPFTDDPDCGWCDKKAIENDALALLREQEPVPVIITSNEPFGAGVWCDCGNCGETLIILKYLNTELASKMIRYCRKCGRAVKWDD